MKYEQVIKSENLIEYGIINGDNTLLYIKVGNGGSIYGYNNKYIEIATKSHEKTGCTVLVASNPLEINEINNIENDMEFIKQYFNDIIEKIYAFGHSNGGVILSNYSYKFDLIKKVLIINAPLNINWHKIKEGLLKSNSEMVCIYGTKDPSYRYLEMLKNIDNIKVIEVIDADHDFSNSYNEFINAPIKYLF